MGHHLHHHIAIHHSEQHHTSALAISSSGTVLPSPLGYCSVARAGTFINLAADSTRLLNRTYLYRLQYRRGEHLFATTASK